MRFGFSQIACRWALRQPLDCRAGKSAGIRAASTSTSTSPTSKSKTVEIPTRHSIRQPNRVCRDPVELTEETKRLLETPVGGLYASQASAAGAREEAYDIAYDTIQLAEYLQLGHSSQIPGSLYFPSSQDADRGEGNNPVDDMMKPLLLRMQQEGEMYMQLRSEKLATQSMLDAAAATNGRGSAATSVDDEDVVVAGDEGYLPSSDEDDDESSSSDGSSSSDEEAEALGTDHSKDFAPPGPTSKIYEALLDAMACVGEASPRDYYGLATQVLVANDLDSGTNYYTLPTMVTYNAALRGIANCEQPSDRIRDEAMSYSFALYNHLTHSLHLPRNTMTMVYMLQMLDKALPPSRVKGNMSVTFWDHASQSGIVNQQFVDTFQRVHEPSNGPEFQILLDMLSDDLPQKHRRFVKKYSHSEHY